MHRQDDGFSLIELLVSLVILGFLSVMLVEGLRGSNRVWTHLGTTSRSTDEVMAAQMILRNVIEELVPLTRFDSSPPYADIIGSAVSLNFYGLPTAAQRPAELQQYRLERSDKGELVLASQSSLRFRGDLLADSTHAQNRIILIRNVKAIDISYFSTAVAKSTGWTHEWRDHGKLPQLVRIDVIFDNNDRRIWPGLLIAPRITLDTQCITDQRFGLCGGRV